MKKINVMLAGVIFSAFVLTFSSCNRDDDETAAATNGSATITGVVTADINVPQAGLETVPDGTVIRATISSEDLVLNPSGDDYADIVYTTTTTGGAYTLTVNANAQPVTVTVMPQDFVTQQIVPDPANGTGATKQERAIFEAGNSTVTVVNGQTQILDLNYTRSN